MNIRFLEAFVWAARLGSFRAAADKLNITQAAISNRIASLEDDFETRLFEREGRENRLTFEGRRLLGYAERMLALSREMTAANRVGPKVTGLVRIGAIETVVHTWLIDFLRRVQQQYPGIEIQLTTESTRRLHEQLQQGELDIALQSDQVSGVGIRNAASGAMGMGWVGRAEDWPAGAAPASVAELVQHPIVTMNRGSQPYNALKDLCDSANVQATRIHCVSSIAAIVRLAQSGFGIAVLPLAPAREQIDNGSLNLIACSSALAPQRLVVSYCADLTTTAIQLVARLASEEAARFAVSLGPGYGVD